MADLCTREGLPVVLGHARSRNAIHGGTATHDRIDAHTIAVRLRGGLLPQASVYPAAMRAPRDRLRRRISLMRTRAERLTHVHHTKRQDYPAGEWQDAHLHSPPGRRGRAGAPGASRDTSGISLKCVCGHGGYTAAWNAMRPEARLPDPGA